MLSQFANFKRYDPQTKKRLAIFAELKVADIMDEGFGTTEEKYLDVVIIPCSRSDQFCRNTAKALYSMILVDNNVEDTEHTRLKIPLSLTDNPKSIFLHFCSENYVKPELVPVKWALKFPPLSKVG